MGDFFCQECREQKYENSLKREAYETTNLNLGLRVETLPTDVPCLTRLPGCQFLKYDKTDRIRQTN